MRSYLKNAFLIGIVFLLSSCATASTLSGQATGPAEKALFDFYIPWDDDAPNAINLANLSKAPAGTHGFITAGSDGHLYTAAGRIRLWGVTMSLAANFPEMADAPKIARHLAKYGVNLVRFFDMDYRQRPDGIWLTTDPDRELDPSQLNKLDFFVSELKKNGIYADLNLLSTRPFNRMADLSSDLDEIHDWKTKAALGFFDRPLLDLQKKYAHDLLTHKNPYTGTTYAAEPAVALIELNNENGMAFEFMRGDLDGLPLHYKNELKGLWNAWLAKRYHDDGAMRTAWKAANIPLGDELLANGSFSSASTAGWTVENNAGARTTQAVTKDGPNGMNALRLDVVKAGSEEWHVQLNYPGLGMEADVPYALSFYARANDESPIKVEVSAAHSPYQNLGFQGALTLTQNWKRFDFSPFVLHTADDNARVNFSGLGKSVHSIWVAGVSLRQGGVFGLAPGENLTGGGIDLFTLPRLGFRTQEARKDWYAFLLDVESRYWKEMYDYVKTGLRARPLIYGSIVGCSTPTLMAGLDAVDTHDYWNHPVFASDQWDVSHDWYLVNAAMVNNPYYSTVSDMFTRRVKGKPQLVTEYGHPFPNTFAAEGLFILSAYAGFQDWDVLVPFSYSSRYDDWDLRKIANYFDFDQNPNLLAAFVPAALAFRRFDVKPAQEEISVALDRERETGILPNSILWKNVDAENSGVPRLAGYLHRLSIDIVPEGTAKTRPLPSLPPTSAAQTLFPSDTGELLWDVSRKGQGVFTVDSALTKMVVGFSGGRRYSLGDVVVEPGQTLQRGFSVIAATVTEGASFKNAQRIVITALGAEANTGMLWQRYKNGDIGFPPGEDEHVTLQKGFGDTPSRVEGIPAVVSLPVPSRRVKVWALDARGNRTAEVAVPADPRSASIAIGPQYKALWYEVVIE
jgi:hypothetical protein